MRDNATIVNEMMSFYRDLYAEEISERPLKRG